MAGEYDLRDGCSLIVVVGIALYFAFDALVTQPNKAAAEKAEFEKNWGVDTIEFVSKLDCLNLPFEPKQYTISKFLFLYSYENTICQLGKSSTPGWFAKEDKELRDYFSTDIDSVSTLIVFHTVEDEVIGYYDNGSPAISKSTILHFIDKESKTIFRKDTIPYLGAPKSTIERRTREKQKEFFGSRNDFLIKEKIKEEIFK